MPRSFVEFLLEACGGLRMGRKLWSFGRMVVSFSPGAFSQKNSRVFMIYIKIIKYKF